MHVTKGMIVANTRVFEREKLVSASGLRGRLVSVVLVSEVQITVHGMVFTCIPSVNFTHEEVASGH